MRAGSLAGREREYMMMEGNADLAEARYEITKQMVNNDEANLRKGNS
jgi:hypothetical protein